MAYPYGNPGVWGTAGGKVKKPTAVARTTSAASYDPAQSAKQAASQIIAEMVAQVKREQEAARQTAQLEAARELAKGQALAYGLKDLGIAGQVQQIFQNAAANQSSLAQGFSGQIRDQASADAAAQQNTLRGTGQEGAVRNQGDNMGNVAYGAGGYIPGNELNTLAAAFGANAALQPGFATQFGQLGEAERMRQWALEQTGWGDKIAEAIGKKPGLFQELLSQNRSYANDLYSKKKDQRDFAYQKEMDRQAAKLKALEMELNWKMGNAELTADQAQQVWENAYKESELALDQYKAQASVAARDPRNDPDNYVDSRGRLVPKGYRYNQRGELVRSATAGKSKSGVTRKNGLTKSQYTNALEDARKLAPILYSGKANNASGRPLPPEQQVAPVETYQQAVKRLQEAGLNKNDAVRIANEYWEPGEAGRPMFTKKQIAAFRRKGVTWQRIRQAMNDPVTAKLLLEGWVPRPGGNPKKR